MASLKLRVTERALVDDFLLDSTYFGRDAREIVQLLIDSEIRRFGERGEDVSPDQLRAAAERRVRDRFPFQVLFKFIEARSQNPLGQEATKNLAQSQGRIWNLHAGDYRGFTWYDKPRGTVWLAAAGFHRSGAADDIYKKVERLDAGGHLLPTPAEIAKPLEDDVDSILERLSVLPELVQRSLDTPGVESRIKVMDAARVSVIAEVEVIAGQDVGEVYIGVKIYRNDLGADPIAAVIALAFPGREIGTDIKFRDSFPTDSRPAEEGEIIISCMVP